MPKLALNGPTIILVETLKADRIAVSSMCPSWVRTDMGAYNADHLVEEGANSIVWLADAAWRGLTGKFFRDRQVNPW